MFTMRFYVRKILTFHFGFEDNEDKNVSKTSMTKVTKRFRSTMMKRQECILLPFVPPLGAEKSVLGNSREESHPKGSKKSMEGRREKERRIEKKEEGSGWKRGKVEREEKGGYM